MARYTAPRKVGLPFADWPSRIQQQWSEAIEPGDTFSNPGGLSHLKPKTLKTVQRALEKWLFILEKHDLLDPNTVLSETYSKDSLRLFIDDLRSRTKTTTVVTQLRSLSQAFGALCSDLDRSLLRGAIGRLRRDDEPTRVEEKELPGWEHLRALADTLMATWEQVGSNDQRVRAAQYRDGLMISFLCYCPVRLANLSQIEIGTELVLHGNTWVLSFSSESMKAGKAVSFQLPFPLVGQLENYLNEIHPILSRNGRCKAALWPSLYNTKISESAIYSAISRRIRAGLSLHVTPHDIRHIIASYIATQQPENARMAAPLLQHGTLTTTESHYIHGQHHQASRRYQLAVEATSIAASNDMEEGSCLILDDFLEQILDDLER